MDVLLLKQEFEEKYRLFELLRDSFNVKIIPENDFIADMVHTRTNTQFIFDPNTVKSEQILMMPMTTNISLSEISSNSIDSKFKMNLFRDRIDLAKLIKKLCTESQSDTHRYDPVKFISLLTWERQGLPEKDCKIILEHFKSVDNLFDLSLDAREFSVKSLKISEKSKKTIIKIFAEDQDYFID